MTGTGEKSVPSDMRLRVMTAIAFIPVVYLIFNGGMIAALLCLIIGAMMAYEAVTIAGYGFRHPFGMAQFLLLIAPSLLIFAPSSLHGIMPPSYLLGMAMVGLAFTAKDTSAKITFVAITACVFSLINIMFIDNGIKWIMLAVAAVVAADSAAYFGGRAIGGAKLAPMISPSKTWSGALCGVTAGGIAGYAMGVLLGFPSGIAALAGLVIADLSIGGDLLESWFKRRHNVKDSGRILPGHGGFLDRFDGYLIVLPVLYLALINGIGKG